MSDTTTTSTVRRDIPRSLISLARLAIERGAVLVSIAYENLHEELAAPAGWKIRIQEAGPRGFAVEPGMEVNHRIGQPLGELRLAGSLATEVAVERPVNQALLDIFSDALYSGWEATYQRHLADHMHYTGVSLDEAMVASDTRHSVEIVAPNWDYWADTDAPGDTVQQMSAWLSQPLSGAEPSIGYYSNPSNYPWAPWSGTGRRRIKPAEVALLAAHLAPGFRNVAVQGAQGDWVL